MKRESLWVGGHDFKKDGPLILDGVTLPNTEESRKQVLRRGPTNRLKAPGLSNVKQAHLYTKWRKLVPVEFKDLMCPHPGEDVLKKQKAIQKKKRAAKALAMSEGAAETGEV